MNRGFVWALLPVLAALSACGPSGGSSKAEDSGAIAGPADVDNDGISDEDEGISQAVDSDDDGTPDYLDEDSDNDGKKDQAEAGDNSASTAPKDADEDGVANFRDDDSDGNGISDQDESEDDVLDGDGHGNWIDTDDDGDFILDIDELGLAAALTDTDGDQLPDYHDIDSDADSIADAAEGLGDSDSDTLSNFRDPDSDGDCISDQKEAGDLNVATTPQNSDDDTAPDFLDVDSDNDGLADQAEDLNCNGVLDASESAADQSDTDGDGASDLVENAAGTSPQSASDNPAAHGDFVFVVPYEAEPSPKTDDLDFSTSLKLVDLYLLMDLSGSMGDELSAIKSNMNTVLQNLSCDPGQTEGCIPDLWSGLGTYTYAERDPFTSVITVQANPSAIGNSALSPDFGSCVKCAEPHYLALWSTFTGKGSDASSCVTGEDYNNSPGCDGSAAGAEGVGFPCFRPNALPVVLLVTDEAPSESLTCPSSSTVATAANAVGAKIVGIMGSSPPAALDDDLATLAEDTGTVDTNGQPLVFSGANSGADEAIFNAIQTLTESVPFDVASVAIDDVTDDVNAVSAFVEKLETLQLGTAECSQGLQVEDRNGDGVPDSFVGILPGTPVCWQLTAKSNVTVAPTLNPQLFRAVIDVYGDNVTLLDQRDVYFLVPPKLPSGGID